ncbi:MFS transporter [Nocardioides alcanivorans]|uniref:MFS transporter n=1 Tax=Nocardioides alcanivorans TaxID=2897352 RepID=UPI001F355184|nr:MFS transporter [Nocardioides alcanivorans]
MADSVTPPRGLLVVLCSAGIVVSMMHTVIVPLVPQLPVLLETDPAHAYWAVTVTLLAAAVLTPIAGRLGDMFGKKRILICTLLCLTAGAVVSALADSILTMVIGRGLQGAASGAVALGISILRDELPKERVGPAIALMSSSMGLGGAIGLPIAAVIADATNWHALFWIAGAMSLLCLVAVIWLVPESPVKSPGRFDVVGSIGLAAGLVCLMLGTTRGNQEGWTSPLIIGLFAAAVVIFPIWGWHQLRQREPLVDLRVSARPQVLFTNIASIAVGFTMYGTSLICTQILMAPEESGYGLGLSMVETGLVTAPGGVMMFIFSRIGAKVSAARGPRTSLLAGTVIIGLGYALAVVTHTHLATVVMIAVLVSAGIGMAFAAMPALIMGAVPVTETAAANGLNSLMRSLGTTSSAAVLSAVLSASTVVVAGDQMASGSAITRSFVVCLGASVLALALSSLIPRRGSAEQLEHGPSGVVAAKS